MGTGFCTASTPTDAQRLGVKAGGEIDVALETPRGTVLRHVALRIDAGAVLELHLDTDEANAAGLRGKGEGVLQPCDCAVRVHAQADQEDPATCSVT